MPVHAFARRSLALVTLALGAFSMAGACSSSGHSGSPGGPVEGAADNHCASKSQKTSQSACQAGGDGGGSSASSSSSSSGSSSASSSSGAGGSSSASSSSGAGGGDGDMSDYGPTLNNAEADDDDCKYHVKWTSTDIYENEDVTFTVVVTSKADGGVVTGAAPEAEVFLNETHPAPNSDQKATEGPTGTYKVGPVRFDASGKWTVRFHLFEECADESEESPHGHVAFYVNVP